jgi:hypothetical protein
VDKLIPLDTPSFFYEKELKAIENELGEIQRKHFPATAGAKAGL